MAALYVDAIRTVQPTGPYLLGGWSFGGAVAFEMAQQLRSRGEQVALLALFDSWSPSLGQDATGRDDVAELNLDFLREAGEIFGLKLDLTDEAVRRMGQEEALEYLLSEARKANVATVGPRQIRGLRDVYFQNVRSGRNYVPRPYDGPVTLFTAKDHPLPASAPKDHGWGALTTRALELYEVPGDHYTLLRRPLVEHLAELLRKCLARMRNAETSSTSTGNDSTTR
jgi:thioesterase domain-containing protein